MQVPRFFRSQSKRLVLAEAFVLLALVGMLDYLTGWELSVSTPYALIVFFVAWSSDRAAALSFAVMCMLSWCLANREVNPYTTIWGYGWACFARLVYFTFVAVGGTALKGYRESNKARIAALERARDLEHEIALVSEREQRRIGQDLHDGICQMMAAAIFSLSSIRDELRDASRPEAEPVDEVLDILRRATKETRDLARRFVPVQMAEDGLEASLDELVGSMRRLLKINATFESQGEVEFNDPETATHLYRIAQEALNNAAKHAGAGKVLVSLGKADGVLQLKIADDGRGLSSRARETAGLGLRTMEYRAKQVGGGLSIQTNPGGGTTVICTLPLTSVHVRG